MSLPIYPHITSLLAIRAQLLIRGKVTHQCQNMQIHVSQLYLSSRVPDGFFAFWHSTGNQNLSSKLRL